MIRIIPAILETSLAKIAERLSAVVGVAPTVQLDVVDGVLVPTRSWPYTPRGPEEFRDILSGQSGLPHWENFDFEVDLMVKDAVTASKEWVGAGASRIIVHLASPDARQAIQFLQEARASENFPVLVGVALSCDDAPEELAAYEGQFDYVQVMGIARIGVQGSVFDDRALALVSALHIKYPTMPIQVDGGVREENASAIAKAGAKSLVAGSAIFADGEPRANIEALKRAAK